MNIKCEQADELAGSIPNASLYIVNIDPNVKECTELRQIILSPKIGAPCMDPFNCTTVLDGAKYALLPRRIPTEGNVQMFQLLPSSSSRQISEVSYFIDQKIAYRSKKIEPFNKGYVSSGEHELTTLALLADGQALKSTEIYNNESTGVLSYTKPFIYRQLPALKMFGVLLLMIVTFVLMVRTAYIVRKKVANKLADKSDLPATEFRYIKFSDIKENAHFFKNFMKWPLFALALFALVSSFFLTVYTVDGVSMQTTYADGSKRLLLKTPVTFGKISRSAYLPSRGDVIVFKKDGSEYFDSTLELQESRYVKRVLALPGETIRISDGKLTVYNKQYPDGFDPDKGVEWSGRIAPSPEYNIDMTLAEDEIFVSGDNRPGSYDSRTYGPIKLKQIIGKSL
jgi:signal peptidase I